MIPSPSSPQTSVFVTFRLDEQCYGLALETVVRIVQMVEVSPLPKAPGIVLGVIDVAGQIVPVFDIRQRFRLPPRPANLQDRLVLARTTQGQVALIVDEVFGVVESTADLITPPEDIVPGLEFVSGIYRQSDGLIFIHDLDTFLSGTEAAALTEALSAAPTA